MSSQEGGNREPGFAVDLTDGRKPGDWKSRYVDEGAVRGIRCEAIYLAILGIVCLVGVLAVFLQLPQLWLHLSADQSKNFSIVLGGFLAGILGGTANAIKWLYHAVGHATWHVDRRLWRLFSPHVAGVLAMFSLLGMASGILSFFNASVLDSQAFVMTIGFVAGYFSDSAAGKLAEIATSLFGTAGGNPSRRG